jgi:hypothetical protein
MVVDAGTSPPTRASLKVVFMICHDLATDEGLGLVETVSNPSEIKCLPGEEE